MRKTLKRLLLASTLGVLAIAVSNLVVPLLSARGADALSNALLWFTVVVETRLRAGAAFAASPYAEEAIALFTLLFGFSLGMIVYTTLAYICMPKWWWARDT